MSRTYPILAVLFALLFSACSAMPGKEAALSEFAESQKKAAEKLEQQGEPARSLALWQSLQVLGADSETRSAITRLERRIDKSVSNNIAAARLAYSGGNRLRGDHYMLKVLALKPGHTEALRELRNSDAARARAQQQSKQAYPLPKSQAAPDPSTRQQLQAMYSAGNYQGMLALEKQVDLQSDPESAALLRRAHIALADTAEAGGNTEKALAHLQAAMVARPIADDPLVDRSLDLRKELSLHWYREGSRLMSQNLGAAIQALQKAVEFNPYNNNARRKLTQAQTMQRNLKKIEGS